MENGVIIIAYNKEIYYEYATNLAHSIKLSSNVNIQLICDKAIHELVINNGKIGLFDYITDIGENKYSPGEIKTMMYDLSFFDKTIFIDSDSLIFPNININWLFDEYREHNFVCPNIEQFNLKKDSENSLIYGGKFQNFVDHFKLKNETITNIFSFFMYFKKSKETKEFFDEAKKIYKELSLNKDIIDLKIWQNCVADELAFTIATCKTNVHPGKIGYSPILTDMEGEKGQFSHFLALLNMSGKIGMTMPGNRVHPHIVQFYNLICSIISIKNGKKMFTWRNK